MYIRHVSIFFIALINISCLYCCDFLYGKSFLKPRSQSMYIARNMVGWQQFLHQNNNCLTYGIAITPAYSQSFRSEQIANYFFGTDTLCISGSEVDSRRDNDILADYFGLSPTFRSTVHIAPIMRNALIDTSCYLGYQNWFLNIHSPFVWTSTNIELNETVTTDAIKTPYPELYMDALIVEPPAQSFTQAISSHLIYGQVKEGILFGTFGCEQHEKKLADIRVTFGRTIIHNQDGYFAIALKVAIPTGTRPNAKTLFEPIVGNGHHWEFGLGIIGNSLIWQEEESSLNFYVDMSITHLFKDRQPRSFDLYAPLCECNRENRFGSRYILMKEFDTTNMYTGNLVPGINRLTLCASVSIDIQFDITAMFEITYKQYTWDFGYEGWVRSREKICYIDQFPQNKFALKGIQNTTTVFGNNSPDTQNTATLHGNLLSEQTIVTDNPSPIYIDHDNINISSGRASRAFTNTIFTHFSYHWLEKPSRKMPFLGLGGQVEFEGDHSSEQKSKPNKNAISQWMLWLKAGFIY